MKDGLRIASRGSALALWQAGAVREALLRSDPSLPVEIRVVHTKGDRITDVALSRIGDRGLFTKEVDAEVIEGRADLAVHSLKDVPTRIPDGLTIAAISEREDPRDVLLCPPGRPSTMDTLSPGARVGTSSLRRRAQLLAWRGDLEAVDLRGNLNTRLDRLDRGDYDAILLAAAGVIRLGWRDRISEWLDPDRWLPAVGQGALAIVAREGDERVAERLRSLHHEATGLAVVAERALLRDLEGGCQIPIGALATVADEAIHLSALVASLNGERVLRHTARGALSGAEELGRSVADALRAAGADEVLDEIRGAESSPGAAAP